MDINQNIKKARIRKGKTQEEIAEKLGTNQAMIWRYETGKTEMKAKTLKRYCEILECSADEILGLKKEEKL